VKIQGELLRGRFIERLNRFAASVEIEGEVKKAYLPNPGRLKELLIPGAELILRKATGKRKTCCDLIGVKFKDIWVSIDSRVPNPLFREALEKGKLEEFMGYRKIIPEFSINKSRIDFLLENTVPCLVEVKSCTLVEEGIARFPDAPTERGTRHLLELISSLEKGYRCAIVFVIQRSDAKAFSPNEETDMEFSETLRLAFEKGVEVYAYNCSFDGGEIEIKGRVRVIL